MIELQYENKSGKEQNQKLFEEIFCLVSEKEGLSEDSSLSLTIVDSDEMRGLNGRYRGLFKSTDVLSFPCELDFVPFLGDIIIDIYTADRQKGINSLSEELQILFLHGLLHLLGYDHLSVKQKKEMEDKEKYYINLLRSKP